MATTAILQGSKLIITTDANLDPKDSKSGKTLIVASTSGNMTTTVMVKGKPVIIGLNAYIKK